MKWEVAITAKAASVPDRELKEAEDFCRERDIRQIVIRPEQLLIDRGFLEERVRIHGRIARIEVPPKDIERLASSENRETIWEEFKRIGFLFVTLDLGGYRVGSMNETIREQGEGE